MQMDAGGRGIAEIRTAIEGKYAPHFRTMTPTPAPPPRAPAGKR